MTNETSPRPWRADEYDASFVRDAGGRFVARADAADAALIVAAVNERDRRKADEARYRTQNVVLRDIVRRLLPLAETTVENIRALGTAQFPFMEQIKSDRLRGDINREVANADYLLREARAAIGEETI